MFSQGILHQSSCAHTPQQNGVAERKNRHLIERARTLLIHNHVPLRFWGDAVLTACYLINRMPSSVLRHKSPHSILYPDQNQFPLPPRVFGCTSFVQNLTPGKDKLQPKSTKCVFLGYSRLQKGYKCYDSITNRYFISADVTFFETSPYFSPNTLNQNAITTALPTPTLPAPKIVPPLRVYSRRPHPNPPPANPIDLSSLDTGPQTTPSDSLPASTSSPAPVEPLTDDANLPIALRKGTRSTRNPYPIYNFLSYHRLSPSYHAFISNLSTVPIPKTVSEAMSHPGWRQAMIEEMTALHTNGTWEIVPLPQGKTAVGCRWVFTVKVGPDGEDCFCSPTYLYGSYVSLASSSVGHQKCLLAWRIG